MTHKSGPTNQNSEKQPPLGISSKDWARTPVSVQKLVSSLLYANSEGKVKPENHLPILVILFLNVLLVVWLSTIYPANKVALPCVTPHEVSRLSVAAVLLMFAQLTWRNVYTLLPSTMGIVIPGGTKLSPSILNEIHPWKLSGLQLGILTVVLFTVIFFLNLNHLSPFYRGENLSAFQGFSIQRLDKPLPEKLASGDTLSITASERILVEALFPSKEGITCNWYSAMSSQTSKTGCSIVLDEPSRTDRDTLAVFVQSACGTQDIAGLHVEVQR